MSTERDTHFKGFAGLLTDEIDSVLHLLDNPYFVSSGMRLEVENLIAQRAFDLAEHVIKHQHGSDLWEMQDEGLAHFLEVSYPGYTRLPDLTEWPTTAD